LASIVSLMQLTHIRVGNASYEKAYGSYGLSTMKDKHVKINGSRIQFVFKGKKGVLHHIDIKSKKLARIVQQCKDIPGKELFQYYGEDGNIYSVDSGEVNEYIKQISHAEFTSKDFRTWNGTLKCMIAFKELGECETITDTKKNIVAAIDMVAKELGNTRTVCRSHYIHPLVINYYENKKLSGFFNGKENSYEGLNQEEAALMHLLKSA
jgi:DNA topoisomerase-1